MKRMSDEEVLAILAPFVNMADIKARNARMDAKKPMQGKVKHFCWSKDADVAREMDVQVRSVCGRVWFWPLREKHAPERVFTERDCKLCVRGYRHKGG